MGRLGKVIKAYIDKLSGSSTDAQHASVEEFAGDERKVQVFGPCNEDFAPPENCKTINIPLGRGRGFLISAAYHNQQIPPVAIHGERRLYSTNQAGDTVTGEVFLKQDGTILIKNAKIAITVNPSGKLEIEADGNTEITSLKTIINNDVDIIGDVIITGGISWSGVAKGVGGPADFEDGLTNTGGDIVSDGKSLELHTHPQGNDSDGDSEVDTGSPI